MEAKGFPFIPLSSLGSKPSHLSVLYTQFLNRPLWPRTSSPTSLSFQNIQCPLQYFEIQKYRPFRQNWYCHSVTIDCPHVCFWNIIRQWIWTEMGNSSSSLGLALWCHVTGMCSSAEVFLQNRSPETRGRVIAEILLQQINPIFVWADENTEIIIKQKQNLELLEDYDRLEPHRLEKQIIWFMSL